MENVVIDTDKRLNAHEQVCAERYKGILESFDKGSKRMQKIEYLLYGLIAAVLLGPNFTAEMIKTFLGK